MALALFRDVTAGADPTEKHRLQQFLCCWRGVVWRVPLLLADTLPNSGCVYSAVASQRMAVVTPQILL
jgi:hypothetical protein